MKHYARMFWGLLLTTCASHATQQYPYGGQPPYISYPFSGAEIGVVSPTIDDSIRTGIAQEISHYPVAYQGVDQCQFNIHLIQGSSVDAAYFTLSGSYTNYYGNILACSNWNNQPTKLYGNIAGHVEMWGSSGADPRKNNGCSGGCSVGDPINTGTGNEFEKQEDFSLPGTLTFERYYNSDPSVVSAHIGAHWRDAFDRSVSYATDGANYFIATVFRPDGKEEVFQKTGGVWAADPDIDDTLLEQDNAQGQIAGWKFFNAAARQFEYYDASGLLTSIQSLNGQSTTLTYSTSTTPTSIAPAAGLLITVTDPSSRQLQFIYNANSQITQITLPDGGTLAYAYDTSGNLSQVTYPDNRTRAYKYAESSNAPSGYPSLLTGIIDEDGQRYADIHYVDFQGITGRAVSSQLGGLSNLTKVAYSTKTLGYPATVTYPSGVQSTIGFATQYGRIKAISASQPCGQECTQTAASQWYDANGNLGGSTDFNGVSTAYTYDSDNLETQRIEAQGTSFQRTTNTTWNTTLRVPLTRTVQDAHGTTISSTQWVYNTSGQTLARCAIDPTDSAASGYACSPTGTVPTGVRRWIYTYCTAVDMVQCPLVGLLLAATGPRTDLAQTATYRYYMSASAVNCGTPGAACHQPGDLYQVTDALGHVTTIASYDADGRITRETDANGINTDLTYTPRGWLAGRTVGSAQTTVGYTPYGSVSLVTDPDGVAISYGYDTAHRLTDITDALGNRVHYTLDEAGNKTAEQVYDASGTVRKSLSRTFNSLGQLTTVIDGLNQTVFSANASDGYNVAGNLVHSTDGRGIQQYRSYDALNRLTSIIDNYNGSDTGTANTTHQFAMDSLDHLTQVIDPSGLATTYGYDGLNDATGQTSPDTGSIRRTFDAAGNLLTNTDAKGITATYTYDTLDRLIGATYVDSTQNVAYHYDEANSVTGCSSSYPIGRLTRIVENAVTTVYCYDAQSRVIEKQQIIGTSTETTGYAYTVAGRLSGLVYPSGTMVAYTHDRDGRIQSLSVTPANGTASTAVSGVIYQPFGPISAYTLGNGQVVTRTYDANYRLTDLTSPAFSVHVARGAMGNITAIGNVPGANPATETYSYDPLYHLTAITAASGNTLESATYNPTGDRLSKTGGGLSTGTYSYNPGTHQLVATGSYARAVDSDGNTTGITAASGNLGLGYSDRNRMILAQVAGSTVANYTYDALGERIQKVAGTANEHYSYDEGQKLLSESGATSRDYVWMDEIPVANVDTGTVNYVIADGLGTPRVVVDSIGATLWQWAYQGNAWGEAAPTSSSGYVYNLRFPGQYYDSETGLANNVNRDYDAATGRYIQSDSVGLEAGPSTYSYANTSPLDFSDSNGEQAYAYGPYYRSVSTIYCDGLGAIAIWLIQENPCWDDCTSVHENSHRTDALRSNPNVCLNQPKGTQVWIGSTPDAYKSEVKAYDAELDCLRKKLATLKNCDQCRKSIEDRISYEEGMKVRFSNWLKSNFYE